MDVLSILTKIEDNGATARGKLTAVEFNNVMSKINEIVAVVNNQNVEVLDATLAAIEAGIPSLSGYATESWVAAQGYLTSADLSGYATENWVAAQGFLTAHQDLSLYATHAWVTEQISDIAGITYAAGAGIKIINNTIFAKKMDNIHDSVTITLPVADVSTYYICNCGANTSITLVSQGDITSPQRGVEHCVLFINSGSSDVVLTLTNPFICSESTIIVPASCAVELDYVVTSINDWDYYIIRRNNNMTVNAPTGSKVAISLTPDSGLTANDLIGCTVLITDSAANIQTYTWNGSTINAVVVAGSFSISVTGSTYIGTYSGTSTAGGSLSANITVSVYAGETVVVSTTGSSTISVPVGATKMNIFLVAGGAGGYYYRASPSYYSPVLAYGGKGGSVVSHANIPVTSGDVITLSVGSGGASGGASTVTGGDTTLSYNGTVYTANGGTLGTSAAIGADGTANPYDTEDTNLYGAGGGGGENQTYYVGGTTGGGCGANKTDNGSSNTNTAGSFYGAGGGASARNSLACMAGYQGIIKIYFS